MWWKFSHATLKIWREWNSRCGLWYLYLYIYIYIYVYIFLYIYIYKYQALWNELRCVGLRTSGEPSSLELGEAVPPAATTLDQFNRGECLWSTLTRPSIRSICTRCCFTKTNMIQVCSNCHWARVLIHEYSSGCSSRHLPVFHSTMLQGPVYNRCVFTTAVVK